jgi:surfeit locus 1 family protein
VNGRAQPRRSPAGVVVPAIAALVLFAGLVALGNWQLDRKVWKEALIDTLDRRLAAAPSALPPPELWSGLTPAEDEYRRVRFSGKLLPAAQALVFTSGSAFRPDVSGAGYWVFAPARLAGGGLVAINRGFVPEGRQDVATRVADEAGAVVDMVGVMRWPEAPNWFTPPAEPAHNLWFVRDQLAMAEARHWGEVAPFFIELESPLPPGGLPQPGPLRVNLPDDHLQYALTWYGLAAVVAVSFAVWLRGRWREAGAPSVS